MPASQTQVKTVSYLQIVSKYIFHIVRIKAKIIVEIDDENQVPIMQRKVSMEFQASVISESDTLSQFSFSTRVEIKTGCVVECRL